jgi:hypothetical protein
MSKFGQYQLLERIAVGGMGEVYRARSLGEEGFEKPVAIKRILPSYASDVRFVEMLVTEARIHAPLNHRNIVQIHDLGISEDHEYFIVLEYVDGHDLGGLLSRLNERRLRGIGPVRVPDAVALYIAIELGEGLHFAHELRDEKGEPLGLIHRDICPSNVLLSYAGEVKLSDFGLAKRNTDHSIVGSLKGQLAYMSPEQARRASLDRRTDIFSLGAVLFEMLTGEPLRTFGDDIAGWQQVASGTVPSARQHRADILPALEQLLAGALAPDPRDRLPDARSFVAEARGALDLLPRSRVGEAGELNALLRGLLPPGRPRPAKAQSKVIRLLSELAAPARERDSSLASMNPAAAGLHAATSPLPAVRDREESRPPVGRSAAGGNGGADMDIPGSRSGSSRDPQRAPNPASRDALWPALLDLVAPPIGSSPPPLGASPAIPVPAAPPVRPPPIAALPTQPAFRPLPAPPVSPTTRLPQPPPRIPWPTHVRFADGHQERQRPEPLTPMEEIERLEAPSRVQPMPPQPVQPEPLPPIQRQPSPMQPVQPLPPPPMQPEPLLPIERQPVPPQPTPRQPMEPEPMEMQGMMPLEDLPTTLAEQALPTDTDPPPEDPVEAPGIGVEGMPEDWAAVQPPRWVYSDIGATTARRGTHPARADVRVAQRLAQARAGARVLAILVAIVPAALAIIHFTVLPLGVLAVWRTPARLEVESVPAGAEVFIDGRRLSTRTPTFIEVNRDFERHVVELRLEGFRSERREISYSRALRLAVSVSLVPATPAAAVPRPPPRR